MWLGIVIFFGCGLFIHYISAISFTLKLIVLLIWEGKFALSHSLLYAAVHARPAKQYFNFIIRGLVEHPRLRPGPWSDSGQRGAHYWELPRHPDNDMVLPPVRLRSDR